jgi:DNA modification methylase
VEAVARSISEFGFRQPIVVDEQGVILVGHTRLAAAKQLGLTEVPVHVAVGLTPEQARGYRIADNQTSALSSWDDDKLVAELLALQQAGFSLDLTGFSADELNRLLEPPAPELLGDPDEVPEPPAVPETRPGDVWLLGKHRLLCGDATKPADVARLLGDTQVDLLLTDPPYSVGYTGKTADALTIENDAMDDESYRAFLKAAFTNAVEQLKPGGSYYVWHADSKGLLVRLAIADVGLQVRQCLFWSKNSMVLGRQDYQWKHEPCLHGWKDGAAHTWLNDRSQTTVLEFDKPARNGEHPTMKPVALISYLIGNSCPVGGLVFDPFGGSGTTLIAAEQINRRAALIELDPQYVDVIVRRWETLTGRTAERVSATDSATQAPRLEDLDSATVPDAAPAQPSSTPRSPTRTPAKSPAAKRRAA